MRPGVALTVFALVFVAELPDKTALATLVLATRYRPLPVWTGVALAFAVQCGIAVAAGGALALLPHRPVRAVAAVLFAVGAVAAFRGHHDDDDVTETTTAPTTTTTRMVATSFAVLFVAEWGDFTQIATATLAARYADPVSVFAGAWLALLTVAAMAIVAGRALLRVVPLAAVRRLAGVLFAVVAVLTAIDAARG